jgi:hypothetical protein
MDIPKHFISGHYVIREIFCVKCMSQIGWRYMSAEQKDNEFKVGHYVVEVVNVKIRH